MSFSDKKGGLVTPSAPATLSANPATVPFYQKGKLKTRVTRSQTPTEVNIPPRRSKAGSQDKLHSFLLNCLANPLINIIQSAAREKFY